MATSKTLRGYQADLYRRVNRARNNGKDAVMLLPTGAGKTAIARNHCSHVLNHPNHTGIKRVIITTPQKQILAGFLRTNEEEWSIKGKHSSQKIDNVEIIEIANKDIGDFLKGSSGGSIAISCIQSITNQRSNAFNPFEEIDDCSSILWVIDEAHHIEAEQTARVIGEFKRKNGKILYLTATPFNANGALRILNNPDIEIIHRSLGEHMKDGFAPELEMSYEMFDVSAGVQTDYSYVRSDLSRLESWATSIASAYEKDNKPKTLVVIPSFSRSGDGNIEDLDTVNAANTLKAELEKKIQGIKVLSAVGNDASGDLSKAIEVEANTFPGHDIIIACRRFDEGTDVPAIGAVYLIGMTGCRRIIQLMGRALRNKSTIKGFEDEYPDYLNKSIFKFFIFNTTTVTDDDLEDNQYEFSLSAIKTINAVQNFRSYDVISGAVRVRRRLQERIEQLIDEDPDSPDIEILEELVSEIEQPIIALETSGEKDDSMLALMAHNHMDHTNEEALENASETAQAYVQSTLLSNELETDEDVEEFVERSISRKRRNRTANVINEELVELVTQYATEKVNYIESDLIKTFTTSINRNTLEEWGDVLWNTYDNEEKQLVNIKNIISFYEEHNKFPNAYRKESYETKLAYALNNYRRAYVAPEDTGTKLHQSVVDYLIDSNYIWILDYVDRVGECMSRAVEYVGHYNKFGKRPSEYSEDIEEKYLGRWFGQYKAATKGQSTHMVYVEVTKYLQDSLGCDVLDNINRESKCMVNAVSYVEFVKRENRIPSRNGDSFEKRLASWFALYKSAVVNVDGKNSAGTVSYESINIYLKNNLGDNVLSNINLEDRAKEKAVEYVEYVKKTGEKPSITSNDIEEKRLANWLSQYKSCKVKGNNRRAKSFESVNDYLITNLGANILENVDLESKSLENAQSFVSMWRLNNKRPSDKSKDDDEKRLGKWFSHYRSALNGNGRAKTYDSVSEYLKKELGVELTGGTP